jgi:hypothetical protein
MHKPQTLQMVKSKSKNIKTVEQERKDYARNYDKIYYLEHRGELLNYGKIWRLEHPEYMSNYCKIWRLEYPDYNKVWRLLNPDYYKIRRCLKINRLLGVTMWDRGIRPATE